MGCGRVGSTLAHILEEQGHSVAVIDQDREAFRKLGSPFKGKKVTGVGFDQNVLIEAGIEQADAFAAVRQLQRHRGPGRPRVVWREAGRRAHL
jgi:trk system potassium uptake protein TrkA